jgi:transcriptional regulator with XRE-family HTH domain
MHPLAFLRQQHGLPQRVIAEDLGVSVSYVSALETGRRKFSAAQWEKLAPRVAIGPGGSRRDAHPVWVLVLTAPGELTPLFDADGNIGVFTGYASAERVALALRETVFPNATTVPYWRPPPSPERQEKTHAIPVDEPDAAVPYLRSALRRLLADAS